MNVARAAHTMLSASPPLPQEPFAELERAGCAPEALLLWKLDTPSSSSLCSLCVPRGQEGWLSLRACQEEPPRAQGGAGVGTALCSYKWPEGLHQGRTEPFGRGCSNTVACPIADGASAL